LMRSGSVGSITGGACEQAVKRNHKTIGTVASLDMS
jgi:hypothetical protein